jgi:hypothetical protein
MALEISPEPTPGEREAVVKGLERLLAGDEQGLPAPYVSRWRQAALYESVVGERHGPPDPRGEHRASPW